MSPQFSEPQGLILGHKYLSLLLWKIEQVTCQGLLVKQGREQR